MKRSFLRYAELSETSLLEVWHGERRDHEVSLYGPQKNNRKEISTKKKTKRDATRHKNNPKLTADKKEKDL